MSISSIITIASGIVVTLAGTIALLFRMLEKKNDIIIDLTKSYMETTIGVKTALENNTKVIERLASK
jgi:archaellum biogenesis protein FlaJ (TadC family)